MNIVLKNTIANTTTFNALETIRGMLLGFFTSPLIEKYNLTVLIEPIKEIRENDRELVVTALSEISRMMRAINAARKAGVGEEVVGSYTINRLTVPRIETRELTRKDIEPYLTMG